MYCQVCKLKDSARNAVASLQKRLSHRNPNVQLYALEVSSITPTTSRS
jgi:hypothetical protein